MTGPELGFLLLCSDLGQPQRRPLTLPQLRVLSKRVSQAHFPGEAGDVTAAHLMSLGYSPSEAGRIAGLLNQEKLLQDYLALARARNIGIISRISPEYPGRIAAALRPDAPAVLCYRGDPGLFKTPCIALVGSRELQAENRKFAQAVGREAARQGYTLVSGGARGADSAAQEACLAAGGRVIVFVADSLVQHAPRSNVLFCSETGFDLPFSSFRALQRNRLIHALGEKTFVAQAELGSGGTWEGTCENLKRGWSPVFVFRDGSEGARGFMDLGAAGIGIRDLSSIPDLEPEQTSLF